MSINPKDLTQEDVVAALHCMYPRQREAASLVWVKGMSLREAASKMGVRHQTVADLLKGAKARALDIFEEAKKDRSTSA